MKAISSKSDDPAPVFLLAGGPGHNHQHVVGLLGIALSAAPSRSPAVAYVGTASGDDASFFRRMAMLLVEAGAKTVALARLCAKRDTREARRILDAADVIFVSGGDVEAGMQVLQNGDGAALLRARFEAGVPFIGLSAGSIMLGREWITWDDPGDDASARIFPCLNFAPLVCDTHSEDDDWLELRALLAMQPSGAVGYGISAPAMLCFHGHTGVTVHGGNLIRLERKAGLGCVAETLRPAT